MDTFRNLFYAPIYVAVAGGFFHREGLDVMFGTVPSGKSSIAMLKDDEVDIVQTGISRSMMDLDEGNEDAPLHIAEINQGDGFFLVSREPTDGWRWSDLEGSTVIPVGFTPVPWTSLRAAMLKNGVSLERVKLLAGLSAEDALSTFRSGGADYVHMPNPQAHQLVADGVGHIAAPLGPQLGRICYSSFAATERFLDDRPQVARRFVSGFKAAQEWVASSTPDEIARRVAAFLPGVDESVLLQGVETYKRQHTWSETPEIDRDGYSAMADVLIEGGVVKGRYPYERLVRSEFADRAMAS